MKKTAYISHSMNDSELYILSLISEYLAKNEYYIHTSFNHSVLIGQSIESNIENQISKSDLFVGIASDSIINSQWTLKEWEVAQSKGKTAVFIIEDTVSLNSEFEKSNFVIRFNRQYPEEGLNKLQEMIEKEKKKTSNTALNWIVGGLLGIAIIKLLSDD